jgi:general stress protein YciG
MMASEYRQRRRAAGWSRGDLAKLGDVSLYQLRRAECGLRISAAARLAVESALLHAEKNPPPEHEKRGFAQMDVDQQLVIARQGGKTAHARGVAHKFSGEAARTAGQKGGQVVSTDRAYMATIGRLGGIRKAGRMKGSDESAAS